MTREERTRETIRAFQGCPDEAAMLRGVACQGIYWDRMSPVREMLDLEMIFARLEQLEQVETKQ